MSYTEVFPCDFRQLKVKKSNLEVSAEFPLNTYLRFSAFKSW